MRIGESAAADASRGDDGEDDRRETLKDEHDMPTAGGRVSRLSGGTPARAWFMSTLMLALALVVLGGYVGVTKQSAEYHARAAEQYEQLLTRPLATLLMHRTASSNDAFHTAGFKDTFHNGTDPNAASYRVMYTDPKTGNLVRSHCVLGLMRVDNDKWRLHQVTTLLDPPQAADTMTYTLQGEGYARMSGVDAGPRLLWLRVIKGSLDVPVHGFRTDLCNPDRTP